MIPSEARITIISGSGISKASGIPTFRGKDGLWKNYDFMELATPKAFRTNPQLVWEWYYWRLGLISQTNPNKAHLALKSLEDAEYDIVILTQNVDNLHERAGSSRVYHLHGEIYKRRCIQCNDVSYWDASADFENPIVPKCTKCDSMLRPSVVWFNETLDPNIVEKSYSRLQETDLLLIVGTSGLVYPVANFPFIAKQENRQIEIIEFNIESTPLSSMANKTVLGPVEDTLPKFVFEIIKDS